MSEFYEDKRYSDGHSAYCKTCNKFLSRAAMRKKREQALRRSDPVWAALYDLIEKAKASRTAGRWAEKRGIQAYRDLGSSIERAEVALGRRAFQVLAAAGDLE